MIMTHETYKNDVGAMGNNYFLSFNKHLSNVNESSSLTHFNIQIS